MIRTLDACRADLLIMTNRRTRMSHPKVMRGSQGTSVRVPHVEFADAADAIGWLKARRFTVYLAEADDSVSYRRVDYTGRTAIVVGSERYGVSRPWYDAALAAAVGRAQRDTNARSASWISSPLRMLRTSAAGRLGSSPAGTAPCGLP